MVDVRLDMKDSTATDKLMDSEDARDDDDRHRRLLPVPDGILGFFKTSTRPLPLGHFTLYVLFFLFLQGDPSDKSVCGYNMTNPLWVNWFFGCLVFSGAELSFRLPGILVDKINPRPIVHRFVPAIIIKAVVKLLAALCGMSMIGFVALPRCLFNGHQIFVLYYMYGGAALILTLNLLYAELSKVSAVGYFLSCAVCKAYYYEGGWEFFMGEAGFIFSYTHFMTATLHPRLVSNFSFPVWAAVTIPLGYLLVWVESEVVNMCLHKQLIDMN